MIKISAITRLPKNVSIDHIPEVRRNPSKDVSFFEHNGTDMTIIEGINSDSHSSIGFPYDPNTEVIAYGRVTIKIDGSKYCSMALHTDIITYSLLNKIIDDIYSVYGDTVIRAEYYGEMRNIADLSQELLEKEESNQNFNQYSIRDNDEKKY